MSGLLTSDIVNIKGIGKQRAQELNEIGIFTVWELINYFPYRYDDFRIRNITELENEERVTLEGQIYSEPIVKRISNNRNVLSIKVIADHTIITATWFNRAFLKKQLKIGRPILINGKWDSNRKQITVYQSEFLDTSDTSKKDHLLPVYSLPSNISLHHFRKIMINAFHLYYDAIDDYLPSDVINQYKLYTLKDALKAMHFPKDSMDGKHARRRLVYDELLFYQIRIQMFKRITRQNRMGIKKEFDENKFSKLIQSLPFSLTNAQKKVLDEINQDLKSDVAMNRLLQGDVGSGKTIVAILSLYANYLAGFQGAFMVPTEILAEQHEKSLKGILSPLGIEIALLTGRMTEGTKKSIQGQLQMGLIDIIVGTHSLIQENVLFKNLGFVITDEQHRFGVEQRALLRRKGNEITPDVLYMTATPIPRTLAITAFGDMDISIIDEYPAGRKKIETYWVRQSAFTRVVDFIKKQISLGRQAYVICPLIEESDKLDVQNAIDVHALLTEELPANTIGLLHGRLPTNEKEAVMEKFKNNETHVLVSTTVVEVGVNVQNATLMVIYDAERFGLAQLHQLRGRVGRGDAQSYCILMADPKTETGKERMKVMTETNDGFEIARRDLEIRGPGNFFGVKQSGLPDFKLADIIEDYRTLEVARSDANKWMNHSEYRNNPEYKELFIEINRRGLIDNHSLED